MSDTADSAAGLASVPVEPSELAGLPVDQQIIAAAIEASADNPATEIVVPLALFVAIVLPIIVRMYLSYRNKRDVQHTIRAAVERGQELTPDILERIGQEPAPPNRDLRRGVLAVSFGVAIAAFGFLFGEEDGVRPMLALGTLPFLIGLAYIGLWAFTGRGK